MRKKKILYICLLALAVMALFFTGCKIQITVPEGGIVRTESTSYTCKSGQVCTIGIYDIFFDETFIAVPIGCYGSGYPFVGPGVVPPCYTGYEFTGWKKYNGRLCGGSNKPCHLYTSFFLEYEILMSILESDMTFMLEPIFTKQNIDVGIKKITDNNAPNVGERFNFTIEVTNLGKRPETEVEVIDLFPPGLRIPPGAKAKATKGEYNPETGQWLVGEMPTGTNESLRLPAQIHISPQPDCIVSTAELAVKDRVTGNNRSHVTLKRPDDGVCGDLKVRVTYRDTDRPINLCGNRKVRYRLEIKNSGPDLVHNTILKMSENDFKAPGFEFYSPCGGLQCNLGMLRNGEAVHIWAISDEFKNTKPKTHAVTFEVSGNELDQIEENNVWTSMSGLAPMAKEFCPK
jgi:uncharacterized repeat protein (TIGR01451 family)